ncbi:MAG TPA: sulfite exporter TauE/SafE family protein [Candidatus Acidoferrales bacterium]|nr:sulfite exporter TauE/SafE family protein [Candidatus Acidoferrales bacterium]
MRPVNVPRMNVRTMLFVGLGVAAVVLLAAWLPSMRKRGVALPTWLQIGIGFVTNFFDTLGIGSFAPTTSLFKFFRLVPDEQIPGTLNVGHTLPTILEAFAFIAIVDVAPLTLVSLIIAAIAGAWLGSGVVARWPRRNVQIGMGLTLIVAATLFLLTNLHVLPGGGDALGLAGPKLWFAIAALFCLGALMTIGLGLYAPAMILVALLGMNPKAAFPIMMGSCAFLMPAASVRFIRYDSYSLRAALGLTIGGLPGVAIAAFIVKSLPIADVRWLVVAVVLYAAITMLRSAHAERTRQPAPLAPEG